ncbi:MAG TPA: hypothetical protein PKC29_11480 [Thermodesulfobacteriota bacterium]|nr:hypothetical protein [Thermodesulfobacteriota bacterium]
MRRKLIGQLVFPALVAVFLAAGLAAGGCGSNPPFAPFGSTIEILNPPEDINIGLNAITQILVRAQVLGPDEEPLNDVRVIWDLSFADQNSFVIDTNGDGIADAKALQLVDNGACSPQQCASTSITEWFSMGALVDSPFDVLTDNRGMAFVLLLIGDAVIDPATLSASTDSGAIDIVTFSVNADLGE